MKLLLVKYDINMEIAKFIEYSPKNNFLSERMGCFKVQLFDSYFVAIRAIHAENSDSGNEDDDYRVDLQALKISLNGELLGSKIFSADVGSFGYPAQRSSNNLGYPTLMRHYDDLIVNIDESGWQKSDGTFIENGLNLVIDTEGFQYLPPFIVKAQQFERENYPTSGTLLT